MAYREYQRSEPAPIAVDRSGVAFRFRVGGIEVLVAREVLAAYLALTAITTAVLRQLWPGWSFSDALIAGAAVSLWIGPSLLMHHIAHALVGRAQGTKLDAVRLSLFGPCTPLDGGALRPHEDCWGSLAGPLASLLTAAVGGVLWRSLHARPIDDLELVGAGIMVVFLTVFNGAYGLLRLVPSADLDGARLLRAAALLPHRRRFWEAIPAGGLGRMLLVWLAVVVAPALAYWGLATWAPETLIIKLIVYGGWIVSLVLHEFSHSAVAYVGGDTEIKERGYLTLNPLRFAHPVLTVVMPLIFVLAGGMPLIGGATRVNQCNLRGRWWDTAVSLAGPTANLGMALLIAAVFALGLLDPRTPFAAGLAYLAVLQVSAFLWNLLPCPPLDGFGALAPHLPVHFVRRCYEVSMLIFAALIMLFRYLPALSAGFSQQMWRLVELLNVPLEAIMAGWAGARLW
ncbi:MAG: hypothetical protein U0531_17360 [Dehalococcoidia bacterium]